MLPFIPYSAGNEAAQTVVAGSSLDIATTAWVNAVTAAGGSVSETQQGYVDTLIKGLKADSLFTLMDGIFLFTGESDAKQAQIDITNLRVATPHGVLTLAAGGYTSNGSSGYLSTTFNPTTAGGNFTQNSAHLSCYKTAPLPTGVYLGAYDGSVFAEIAGATLGYINNSAAAADGDGGQAGLWTASRTASNLITLYKGTTAGGNVSRGTDATATVGNINANFFLLARNNGGADQFTDKQCGAVTFGAGLSGTQAGNLFTRINDYMTSWGVNV